MADKAIRYVDGGPVPGGDGKARYVYLVVDDRRVARYISYSKQVEAASVTLYPNKIYNSVEITLPGKHVVTVFDIKSR